MRGKKTGGRDWQPGTSPNPAGRPRSGNTLKEVLNRALEKKKGGKTKKQIIIDKLIDMALAGDIRAIDRIVTWDEARFQFDVKTDILDRLERLEDIINADQTKTA